MSNQTVWRGFTSLSETQRFKRLLSCLWGRGRPGARKALRMGRLISWEHLGAGFIASSNVPGPKGKVDAGWAERRQVGVRCGCERGV